MIDYYKEDKKKNKKKIICKYIISMTYIILMIFSTKHNFKNKCYRYTYRI